MTITKKEYPHLFKACLLVLYDHGAVNRVEKEPTHIKTRWHERFLESAEKDTAQLSDGEMDVFCTGECSEAKSIRNRFGLYRLEMILEELL